MREHTSALSNLTKNLLRIGKFGAWPVGKDCEKRRDVVFGVFLDVFGLSDGRLNFTAEGRT